MVDTQYVDWLTWRTHIFEKCYLKGFNNILMNVALDTDDALNRHIHSSDGDEIQRRLDRAEGRMRQNVDKLKAHYSNIPFDYFEVDPCADNISVLKDLSKVIKDNVKSIVYGLPTDQGAKPRFANFEMGLECCIDSALRCMTLEEIERRLLSDIRKHMRVITESGALIASSEEAKDGMGYALFKACEDIEHGLGVMLSTRACDIGFAPLVATRYLLEDYDYWVGELIANRTDEAYDKVNLLSAGMRQVGYLYRGKFDFVLKKLQGIEGYTDFEVIVKDSDGNTFSSTDVNKI